jgi:regulator of sigma E protease
MEMILSPLNWLLSNAVPFVILLGILIFVHELGHFLVARMCGVRVEVFSLGFGKKILKYKKGDTVYALSIVPLGGYVKMFGEQPGEAIAEADKKVSFTHKNVWQRIAVVLAGPLMNFFFAILIFFFVAMIGEEAKTPVLGDVSADSAAYAAGFRSGDRVLSVNGTSVRTWEEIQKNLSLKTETPLHVDFVVQREGAQEQKTISTEAKPEANPNILSTYGYVATVEGISPLSAGTTVGINSGSPLAAMGIHTGDTITAVNGQKITYWRELMPLLEKAPTGQALSLDVTREGEKEGQDKTFTVTLAAGSTSSFAAQNLGIESSELYINKTLKDSPAELAGLHALDRIDAVNGVKMKKWEDIVNSVKAYDGTKPLAMDITRDGKAMRFDLNPKMTKQTSPNGAEDKRYTIGIVPVVNIAMPEMITVKADNLGQGFVRGVTKTWDVSVMTVMSFVRLFEKKISPKNIGGVISIGQAASETFKLGLSQFLQMMAIISINLFILNLLPVPVLDGGHLVFYVIELVKGAPLSLRKMEVAQQVGLAILMSLMVFALFNDFTRILGL